MSKDNEWVSPKIIIGPGATGDYYYKRELIENEIWKEIKKGNNVLISAPRRVGKTSVMKSITNEPNDGYRLIFKNIQGISSEEVFYKTLYELILDCLSKLKTSRKQIQDYFKTIGVTEVGVKSLKLETKSLDYVYEINKIIPQLDKKGEVIVLLIDELPEVLHTLHKSGKNDAAVSILKNLRHWRQEDDYKMLKFVIAGSIGIHHVVNQVEGRSSDINDIKSVDCPALDDAQFDDYLNWAIKDASIEFDEVSEAYFKDKIEYFVPYFINLVLDEIDKSAMVTQEKNITKKDVDNAFEIIIKNNSHFSDWKKRLKDYLAKEDFDFVNRVLIRVSHEDTITIQDLYDMAVAANKTEDYMDLVYDLEHDGYLYNDDGNYRFISPFLKEYWLRTNPIYKA